MQVCPVCHSDRIRTPGPRLGEFSDWCLCRAELCFDAGLLSAAAASIGIDWTPRLSRPMPRAAQADCLASQVGPQVARACAIAQRDGLPTSWGQHWVYQRMMGLALSPAPSPAARAIVEAFPTFA